jgi:tetratricopeptide (TPR) repeat protein
LGELSEYTASRTAFEAGVTFCQTHELVDAEQLCLACYAGALIELGEWDRAARICDELMDRPDPNPTIAGAAGIMAGILHAFRGRPRPARRLLLGGEAPARGSGMFGLEVMLLWGFAVVDDLNGACGAAAERIRAIRETWESTEDLYYVVHPFRWASTFLASSGFAAETRACAEALSAVAAKKGSPEALAALGHALGECALLDGAPQQAVGHFDHALEILKRIGLPFQHASTQVRAAAALAAAGEREPAIERFVDAYRTARRLRAGPLANRAAAVLSRATAGHLAAAAALLHDPAGRADPRDTLRRRFDVPGVTALLTGAGLELVTIHGVRVLADLIPASLAEADPAGLLALEARLSAEPPYRDIAAQLHLLALRPRS